MTISFYELKKIVIEPPKDGGFMIATAAILACGLCCEIIDGMGGPGAGAICRRCGEALIGGRLRGAVVGENSPKTPHRTTPEQKNGGR